MSKKEFVKLHNDTFKDIKKKLEQLCKIQIFNGYEVGYNISDFLCCGGTVVYSDCFTKHKLIDLIEDYKDQLRDSEPPHITESNVFDMDDAKKFIKESNDRLNKEEIEKDIAEYNRLREKLRAYEKARKMVCIKQEELEDD